MQRIFSPSGEPPSPGFGEPWATARQLKRLLKPAYRGERIVTYYLRRTVFLPRSVYTLRATWSRNSDLA